MRVHVGNGSVYLREYVNVDLPLPSVFLAKERPDLVAQYSTLEHEYYARHQNKSVETWRSGPLSQDTVCDAYGSFTFLPVRDGSVSEILSRQVVEHLDRSEVRRALTESHRALRPNGILRIDVPDPDETMREYLRSGDEFYLRHLFGPRRNQYGFHTHYTREMLTGLVESYGFQFEAEEPNIHLYPAFCLSFRRT
jgi:predicted SAM-dependent methyltransferase